MSRHFHTTAARAFGRWFGLDRERLPDNWKRAVEKFTKPGGSAEEKLGKIDAVEIKHRNEVAVHKSYHNRADTEDVISLRIRGADDTKTCHVYGDGTGTIKKHGPRR